MARAPLWRKCMVRGKGISCDCQTTAMMTRESSPSFRLMVAAYGCLSCSGGLALFRGQTEAMPSWYTVSGSKSMIPSIPSSWISTIPSAVSYCWCCGSRVSWRVRRLPYDSRTYQTPNDWAVFVSFRMMSSMEASGGKVGGHHKHERRGLGL
ncbi:hypothetical protein BKA70DRAFT_1311756 [Coprinopsis sp. MPI-PUGE-AT-0042]|nr:hypothetical protein BKA70DRAFT_1311756 [Coprinopsis sp. MPI-PUGE-AT-0042]